jgi:putative oxidoreductase
MAIIDRSTTLARPIIASLESAAPAIDLLVRLYVAAVFWKAGLTKFQSWDSTITLFTYEYQVPLISPEVAAYLGTAAELVFPAMLFLGLGGRAAAAALFVFNIVATLSYPSLWEIWPLGEGNDATGALGFVDRLQIFFADGVISPKTAGLKDHQVWGLLLLIPLFRGPGKISLDHFIRRRFMPARSAI